MAIDDEEQRKAVSGIVTPNASPDEEWRRQVAGVYSFGAGQTGGFDSLAGLDGEFIILDPPSDSPGGGGGEVMPGPPVEWNPASPARNYDWSFFTVAVDGAGQERYSGRGATLVSPSFAVCAHHATGNGEGYYWVPFAGGAEVKRTSTLTEGVDYWNIDGDLGLIKLNSPVTTVEPIKILANVALAASKQCAVIELDRHINVMTISSNAANTDSTLTITRAGSDAIEGGDSGKPAVCFIDGEPVLIITAIESGGAYNGAGPNASHYIDAINAILATAGEELTLYGSQGGSGGIANPAAFSPALPAAFSPASVPLALLGA